MKNEKKLLEKAIGIKRNLFFLFQGIVLTCMLASHAQATTSPGAALAAEFNAFEAQVTGTVTDANGEPMPGVTITIKGQSRGTVTDINGEFSLDAPENATLVFSFIGFKTQEITVGNQSSINVTMQEDIGSLDEFVVTSFGVERDKRSIGYATTTVKADELVKVGTPNLATALYGKAPGVRIQAGAGGATSAVNITIRGINSITGRNQPLIILDGVPIRNEEVNNNNFWGDQRLRGNGLLDINPEDIADISVLKGASAAALYGSEAVNGVLLITTKKGSTKGFKVDFNANYAMDRIAYLPRYQNVRGPGAPSHVFDFGQNEEGFITYPDGSTGLPATNINFGAPFDGRPVMAWDDQIRPYVAQEDNYAALFNDPISSQVNVAISNSTDVADFRVSLTRQDNEALSLNSKNSKNIANINATFRITDKIKTDVFVNYVNQYTANRPYSVDRMINNFGGMMTRFDNGAWYLDKYKTSRGYRYVTGNGQSLTPEENITRNGFQDAIGGYVWSVNEQRASELSNRVIGSITNTFAFTNELSLRTRVSTDFTYRENENESSTTRPLAFGPSGGFSMSNEIFSILYGDVFLYYDKKITDDVTLSATAGYTADKESFSSISRGTNGGLSTENLFDVVASVNLPNNGSSRSSKVIDAALGTLNLNYKGFLYVEGTIRRDRTSTMNPDNNSFVYPSANTSFILSDAVELPSFISSSQLRGSWGIVGNYPDVYRANIAYNQNTLGVQQPGGAPVLFTNISSSFGNDGIRPEQKHEFELGTNSTFFNGRISLDFSYYNAQIRDQILPLTLPATSGATSVLANIGTLRNKGIEIALSGTVYQGNNLNWMAGINFARNRNVVEKLANNATELLHADYDGNAAQLRSVVGRPMGDFFARPVETNANGEKIVQPNGLYKINPNEWILAGNAMPDAVGGIFNNLNYKNFSLNVLADFQIGGSVMPTGVNWMISRGLTEESLNNMNTERGGLSYYVNADGQGVQTTSPQGPNGEPVYNDGMLMDGVTADGNPNTNVISQALYYQRTYNWGGPQYSQARYELYIKENTYLKLRELSVGYSVPSAFAQRLGANSINVSAFGRNLFFFYRNIKDLDPEVLTGGSRWSQTLTNAGTNPATRTVGLMLRASF
ncbi:SusC/RagA family TonB-linked outer membrane protein [Cyclobacterium jeungdonense]|uniref:SusC/RagA family TonB-linked outer membrane protein n=1 Tax=Cyclobacterium jeungdonense TaxID=708087 RepID=A0ABT8CGF3_9BACT|nr:SusC/RagA family TonB-linked outer membrane protein [Cyclobacterium jeungdonense]MDN3690706.1 SusC/RagA family TonB-linked outer membrane protein [Cyclobacterium jeungdonense]